MKKADPVYVPDPGIDVRPPGDTTAKGWAAYMAVSLIIIVVSYVFVFGFRLYAVEGALSGVEFEQFIPATYGAAVETAFATNFLWGTLLVATIVAFSSGAVAKFAGYPVVPAMLVSVASLAASYALFHLIIWRYTAVNPAAIKISLVDSIPLVDPSAGSDYVGEIEGVLVEGSSEYLNYLSVFVDEYAEDPSFDNYLAVLYLGKSCGATPWWMNYDIYVTLAVFVLINGVMFTSAVRPVRCYDADPGATRPAPSRGVRYVRPERRYPPDQTLLVVAVGFLALLPLANVFALGAYTDQNAVTDWADYYEAAQYGFSGVNVTNHMRQEQISDSESFFLSWWANEFFYYQDGGTASVYTWDVGVETNPTLGGGLLEGTLGGASTLVMPTFESDSFQLSSGIYIVANLDDRETKISRHYVLPRKSYVNAFVPLLRTPILFGTGKEPLLSILGEYPIPNEFDDVWDNLNLVYYWGSGGDAYGYRFGNQASPSASDTSEVEIDVAGANVSAQVLDVNVSCSMTTGVNEGGHLIKVPTYFEPYKSQGPSLENYEETYVNGSLDVKLLWMSDTVNASVSNSYSNLTYNYEPVISAEVDYPACVSEMPGFHVFPEPILAEYCGMVLETTDGFDLYAEMREHDYAFDFDPAHSYGAFYEHYRSEGSCNLLTLSEQNGFYGVIWPERVKRTPVMITNASFFAAFFLFVGLVLVVNSDAEKRFEGISDDMCTAGTRQAEF